MRSSIGFSRTQDNTIRCGLISLFSGIDVAVSPEPRSSVTAGGLALAGVVPIAREGRAEAVEAPRG
jgi:hypothetical protein